MSAQQVADERLWTTDETAIYLGVNAETLNRWRRKGYGPRAIPLVDGRGGMIRYRPYDIEAWLLERADAARVTDGET